MRRSWMLGGALLVLFAFACDEQHQPLAPSASASALSASKPKSQNAKQFSVSGGNVGFAMEAADEKIRGRVSRGISGTLFVDIKDLTLTTGNIAIDLGFLEVFQKTRGDDGNFNEEMRDEVQNLNAKQWLELDESTPAPIRAKNRRVEFRIRSIESVSEKNVGKLSGHARTVTLKAKGEFVLHQRLVTKVVDLEATMTFEGDHATAIKLKTVAPFGVRLAEHDVRPRKGFGRLVKEGLEALGSKVAKDALVEIEVDLVLGDEAAAVAAASAAATAPLSASAAITTSDDSALAAESAAPGGSAHASGSVSAAASVVVSASAPKK